MLLILLLYCDFGSPLKHLQAQSYFTAQFDWTGENDPASWVENVPG